MARHAGQRRFGSRLEHIGSRRGDTDLRALLADDGGGSGKSDRGAKSGGNKSGGNKSGGSKPAGSGNSSAGSNTANSSSEKKSSEG